MDREELIRRVLELELPLGEYCVVGAGPMAIRSLRDCSDIDILVSRRVFEEFSGKSGWEEVKDEGGRILLENPPFELGTDYGTGEYWPEPETLIDQADVVEGVAFAKLEEITAFKRERATNKDQHDLSLISEYLYEHPDDDLLS